MKIAITGHRPNKLGNDYHLTSDLVETVKLRISSFIYQLSCDNDLILITGMALGIDTLFAMIAIEHNIPFTAAIPFIGQELAWPQRSQNEYNAILNSPLCTKVIVCEGGYAPAKMQIRNEWMVDHCDILIAVWDGTSGGTANCVAYAKKKLKEEQIYYINPKSLTNEQV